MGKCVLNFDEIALIVQKSDDRHAGNDWMIVVSRTLSWVRNQQETTPTSKVGTLAEHVVQR
jgi:hypothetical protein